MKGPVLRLQQVQMYFKVEVEFFFAEKTNDDAQLTLNDFQFYYE